MSGNAGHARPGRHMWTIPLLLSKSLELVYGLCGVAPWLDLGPPVPLQMIPANGSWAPRPPPDDASDGFSFRVKGGLVIELCFRVCPNDGLG